MYRTREGLSRGNITEYDHSRKWLRQRDDAFAYPMRDVEVGYYRFMLLCHRR